MQMAQAVPNSAAARLRGWPAGQGASTHVELHVGHRWRQLAQPVLADGEEAQAAQAAQRLPRVGVRDHAGGRDGL